MAHTSVEQSTMEQSKVLTGLDIRRDYALGQRVNDDPLVHVIEDFLREDEIAALIAAAQANLQRALVTAADEGIVSQGRTGRNCWIPHHETPAISQLSTRISDLVNLPLDHAESIQVIHYTASQAYNPHFDAWEAHTKAGERCMARGGQRLVTCLLYLNDVAAGGGTCFPKLDMEVRAVRGRMVIFHNCRPGTNQRHPHSLHGGLPVIEGEKWACNVWFRERSRRQAPTTSKTPQSPKSKFSRVI